MSFDNRPKLLRRRTVETITGLSKSTLYKLIDEGRFPRPVKIGARAVAWRNTDITNWINNLTETGEVEP